MTNPIPDKALDDRLGFVGNTGSGKTYAAGTCVERLLAQKARLIIPDPLGVWYGLRLSQDGKTKSPYDVVIFGGPRGDLPITEHAGALIGETCATMKESAIIDLSDFDTKASERRFMLAFLTALYRKANREPLHIIFDEADMWAPQQLIDKEGQAAQLMGVMETVVRRGRIRGFVPWLISQRPAVLSKNVLSQVDGLVAMKLTSSQDRKALGEWIEAQADRQEGKRILGSLPTLQTGQAVVWIPGRGILKTVQFPRKETFDSSRAPKRGERLQSTKLPSLNLDILKKQLSTVEVDAKANDPAVLKAEITRLKREAAKFSPSVDQKKVGKAERDGYARGKLDGYKEGISDLTTITAPISRGLGKIRAEIENTEKEMEKAGLRISKMKNNSPATPKILPPSPAKPRETSSHVASPSGGEADPSLPKGERAILIALAQYPEGCERDQLSVLTAYKRSSRDAYVQRLREKGYVERNGGTVIATEEGIIALGNDYEPLPTGEALLSYWLGRLPEGERKILYCLANVYPNPMERLYLDEETGYKRSSRDAYLQRLKARRLITVLGRSEVRASDELFG